MHPQSSTEVFFPINALPTPIRRRLDAIFDPQPGAAALGGAAKAAEIASIKQRIQDTLQQTMENRRTADGRLILSYESDQEIILDGGPPVED